MKPYLNIGCGNVFHETWENIDLVANSPQVRQHDLAKGLPYDDNTFDAVYASHLLEHISSSSAPGFIQECARVAKSGAVLRFVVPDFEVMVRSYLEILEQAATGDREAIARHAWIVNEIIDQSVRSESGGSMKHFILAHQHEPVMEFIRSRIGQEANAVLNEGASTCSNSTFSYKASLLYRFASQKLLTSLAWLLLGGKGRSAVQQGFLKISGEIHQWIYDRVSLQQLLEKHCSQVAKMDAFTSGIPGFSSFGLDVRNGAIRKPDSLFMEGIKA